MDQDSKLHFINQFFKSSYESAQIKQILQELTACKDNQAEFPTKVTEAIVLITHRYIGFCFSHIHTANPEQSLKKTLQYIGEIHPNFTKTAAGIGDWIKRGMKRNWEEYLKRDLHIELAFVSKCSVNEPYTQFESPQLWNNFRSDLYKFYSFLPENKRSDFLRWIKSELLALHPANDVYSHRLCNDIRKSLDPNAKTTIFPEEYIRLVRCEAAKTSNIKEVEKEQLQSMSTDIRVNDCGDTASEFSRRFYAEIVEHEKIKVTGDQFSDITGLGKTLLSKSKPRKVMKQ